MLHHFNQIHKMTSSRSTTSKIKDIYLFMEILLSLSVSFVRLIPMTRVLQPENFPTLIWVYSLVFPLVQYSLKKIRYLIYLKAHKQKTVASPLKITIWPVQALFVSLTKRYYVTQTKVKLRIKIQGLSCYSDLVNALSAMAVDRGDGMDPSTIAVCWRSGIWLPHEEHPWSHNPTSLH